MQGRMPTEEEWNEWKLHPATKALERWAIQQRLELMEMWAAGEFSAAFDVEMAVKNAGATGACSVYSALKDLDYNQIAIGGVDEEQVRADPSGTGSAS